MKSFLSACLIAFFMLISGIRGYGQQNFATNVKTEISDDKMLITYDAPSRDGTPYYSIILMITYNGKAVQASSIYGDYGSKVEPGMEKAITWYYSSDFKDDIKKVSVSVFAYKVSEPKVYFDILSKGNNGYAPCEVRVSNSSTNVNEYKWDFNDPESGINNLSTEKEPVHIFERAGIYNISLKGRNSLLGLEGTSYNTVEIKEHDPTVADFSFTISGNKPPYEVKFVNTSKNGDIVSWNFGDPGAGAKNNTSDKPNPVYKYKQAGTYMVELSVRSSVSGLSDKVTKEVTMRAPLNPVAAFVFSLSQERSPAIAQFKNTSTNSESFKWNFGDPESGNQNGSTETDPVHTYLKAGKYEVVLIASNPQTGKTHKYSEFITVQGPPKPPAAGFKIGNNNVIGPVTISFTNTSTDADYFTWDFGDPASGSRNTSGDASPVHTFTKPGRYAVVLKAASSKTGESNLFTDYVNIIEPARSPEAIFKIENNNVTAPATIRFSNLSTNASVYSWDFGDPGSGTANKSSDPNPSHMYGKSGTYKVTLTAKNAAGTASSVSGNIVVTEAPKSPVAGFAIGNNNASAPAAVAFSNTSSNASLYSWNFGDPSSRVNTSSEENPNHTYGKAGKYRVTLTAKNSQGAVSTWSDNVTVTEPEKPPVAKFTVENDNVPYPVTVRFRNTSSNAVQYLWDFGDPASGSNSSTEINPSHIYFKAGKFSVTLTAKNNSGAIGTWSEKVTIVEPEKPPVAKFTVENNNAPYPVTIRFKNISSNAIQFSWDFGDPASGSNSSTESNPIHSYAKAGKYPVTLTAKNSSGTTHTWSENVVVTEPEILPVPQFAIENNNAFSPAIVRFTNNSSNAVGYSWDFGDPSSGVVNKSAESNPLHIYDKPGQYQVTLTARNSSGTTRVFTDMVNVIEPPKPPVAKFTIENNNVIGPATVSFSNTSENADTYKWDFGDPVSGVKNTSEDINPVHNYFKPGNYKVRLTASEKLTGTINETEMVVNILEPLLPPVADFSFFLSGQYAPLDITFTNTSENADSYKWTFGDSGSEKNESAGTNPVHRYEKPGTYSITLEARSSRSEKTHVVIKEITISEKYNTFLKTFGKRNSDEVATSLLSPENGQYIALINEQKEGATIVTFDRKGERFTEKKLNSSIYDIIARPDNKGFFLVGIGHPNDLIVQMADRQMDIGNQAIVYSNVYDPGYRFASLHAALSSKNEVGIIANLVNDANETNIWFQKTDLEGKPFVSRGKAFKYVGFKSANQIIATGEGEFAVTGGYQQDITSPGEMMLGMVNSDGSGKISSMRAKQKLTGCDIIEISDGNFEILAARESPNNPDFSELSLKLVDREINPMNCEIDLIGLMRTPDFRLFPPRMVTTNEGYILLSHIFNGTDSDIALLWIDKGGSLLLRKEEIKRPGDQFGTALIRESDGSLVICGAERTQGDLDAIIIKTDPLGRYSDPANIPGY